MLPNKLATKAAPANHGAAVARPEKAPIPDAPAPAKVPRPDAKDGSSKNSLRENKPPTVPRTLPILDIPEPATLGLPNKPTPSAPVKNSLGVLKKFPTLSKKPVSPAGTTFPSTTISPDFG